MANIDVTISGIREAQRQLAELGELLDKATDKKEIERLSKEFNTLEKSVEGANEAFENLNKSGTDLTATFEDIYGEGALPLNTQIGELEDRLYALAEAGQANSQEFQDLTAEVARMRTTIIETDRQVDLLAENRGFSVFGTGITQVGESLLRLDFEGAARDAKGLNAAVGSLGTMGAKALKGLASTVGQLSKAFIKMGVSLLANPVFLLTAAITAIVVAIGALLNELGFLQPILDSIATVFGWIKDGIMAVIQALKDFTDWLGITNFAAKEFAQSVADDVDKALVKINDIQAQRTKDLDQQIRLAQIAGEETTELEIEKQEAIIQTETVRQKALELQLKALEASGDASDEELQKIRDSLKATETLIKDSEFEIKAIQAQADADADKRREEQIRKDQDAYKKRLAEQKAFEQERLRVARQIEDLRLASLEDGFQKELSLNQAKYDRLIEDTLANEKLLDEERTQLIDLLNAEREAKAIELAEKDTERVLAEERKKAEALAALNAEIALAAQQQLEEENRIRKENEAQAQADREAAADARLELGAKVAEGLMGIESLLAATGRQTAGLQKTIALVQIATDTAKAISSVVAGATAAAAAGGPAAPFLIAGYIASGIGTITSAIAGAYKALQAAPSLGGSVSGGSAIPSTATATQPAQPSFDLFGQNNNANNLTAPQDVESNQTIEVKAVVSETEVTETQNTVQKIIQNSSL